MERYTTTQFSMGDWEATIMIGGLPTLYNEYLSHAKFVEQIELKNTDQTGVWFIGVRNIRIDSNDGWPSIVIAQRFEPVGWGFTPAALLVPDTSMLFLGAGTRILVLDLKVQELISEDYVTVGFWGWEQHGNIILMSSELNFAAWDKTGQKLWSKSVEPPWSFRVQEDQIQLDIMGIKSSFDLGAGK